MDGARAQAVPVDRTSEDLFFLILQYSRKNGEVSHHSCSGQKKDPLEASVSFTPLLPFLLTLHLQQGMEGCSCV